MRKQKKTKPEMLPVSSEASPLRRAILESICAGLFASGFCVTFLSYGGGSIALWGVLCAAAAVLCRLLSLLKRKSLSLLLPNAAAALLLLFRFQDCKDGCCLFLNRVISRWNTVAGDAVPLFSVSGTGGTACLLFTILLIAAWGVLLVHWNKPALSFFVLLLLTLPSLLLDSFSGFGVMLYLSGWLLQRICHCEQTFTWRKLFWFTAAAAFLGVTVFFSGRDLRSVNRFREQVKTAVTHFRFGEGSLPEGDLTEAYRMNQGDDTVLIVRQTRSKDLYLRGFVGADYQDGTWKELPRASFRDGNEGIMTWLADHEFLPFFQYASYEEAGKKNYAENRVSVENVGTDRRYLYLPYAAEIPDCSFSVNRDAAVQSHALFGADQYDFSEYSTSYPGELLYLDDDWLTDPNTKKRKSYAACESIYRSFVYQNYLEIPDTVRGEIEEKFLDTADPEKDSTVYEVTQQIHKVLEGCADYTMYPEQTEAEEPLLAFLDHTSGNSAFYATAAVMAYRAFGIPARYAEGYYVDSTQVRNRIGAELSAKEAHAWAEVYMDGLGWIPIEVTPGYYHDVYTLMEMVRRPQNVEKASLAEDNTSQAGSVQSQNSQSTAKPAAAKAVKQVTLVILGIVAVLLTMAAAVAAILEINITIRQVAAQKKFARADQKEQLDAMCAMIPRMLHCIGVEMSLGWNIPETEAKIKRRLPELRENEYLRVNELMEKYIYGETMLAPHEVRVLALFLKKLSDPKRKGLSRRERMRIRYSRMRSDVWWQHASL